MLFFLVLLSSFISLFVFYNFYWKRRTLPPGPTPLPLIGNALDLTQAENVYDLFQEWTNKYGPIHTFWFGVDPIVAVTDYKLIEETFLKDGDTYAGRQQTPDFFKLVRRGTHGIILTQEDLWRDQRRFALHVLRDFGLGKNIMQERILDEISAMLANIQNDIKAGTQEHNIAPHIDIAVGSIINALLFGYRFEGKTLEEFYKLKKLITRLISNLGNPLIFAMQHKTEWFRYIPFFNKLYWQIKDASDTLFGFFERQVNEHMAEIDYNSEPTDFVDAYLREKDKHDTDGENHYYSMPQLLNVCFDLWLAGQETTSNTLAWGVVYLILNQDVQKKLHEELDKVVGSSRLVTLEDRSKLPYTAAIVNETQRVANLVPINVRHTTLKDVEIQGYKIPAGTMIIPHISVVLSDPKVFPEPEKFKPERYLDETGQLKKVDELIPFSIGKRQCLGESLARMELYLFVANIFNQFKITPTPNKLPTLKRKLGGTIPPQPFTCSIQNRF